MIERLVYCENPTMKSTIRDVVVFSLASLLSTRCPPYAKDNDVGLLSYGAPCWQFHSMDMPKLCKIIQKRIAQHEPKLNNIKVQVENDSDRLTFLIEGGFLLSKTRNNRFFQYKVCYPCHLKMI